jgi:hypothetical protein
MTGAETIEGAATTGANAEITIATTAAEMIAGGMTDSRLIGAEVMIGGAMTVETTEGAMIDTQTAATTDIQIAATATANLVKKAIASRATRNLRPHLLRLLASA